MHAFSQTLTTADTRQLQALRTRCQCQLLSCLSAGETTNEVVAVDGSEYSLTSHLTHFGDKSFQPIDCASTGNQTTTK